MEPAEPEYHSRVYEHRSSKLISHRQFVRRVLWHASIVVALLGVSLGAGIIGYVWLAGMTWIDAFLNAAMLLGGMGQIDPLPNDSAKLFAGVYALYAGLMFVVSTGILLAPLAHRILHTLHVDDRSR